MSKESQEEIKNKLNELAKLDDDSAILPQVLLELIKANEDTQKRLGEISSEIQETQKDIKANTKNIDEKLEKTASGMASSLSKKIIWGSVGIAVLIIVATLAIAYILHNG